MDINSILDFVKLTNKFRAVERLIYVTNRVNNENDAEHSYQLAMVAWYLLSKENYGLDQGLVIQYALVHDFVEVYAGDTWFFRTEEESNNKKEREEKAAIRLKKEIPEFLDFHKLISEYKKGVDRESRFVYALDKLIPILNVYLDGGKLWQDQKITFERLIEAKTSKIILSPELEPYFEELIAILKENKHMFHVKHE